MSDLSLRERIAAKPNVYYLPQDVLAIIDDYERDLVARIDAEPNIFAKGERSHKVFESARRKFIALIKPVVKDSLTTQPCGETPDNSGDSSTVSTPRDERPAREKVASWSAGKRNGDEPSYVLSIIEAIDAAADRIARALEGRR